MWKSRPSSAVRKLFIGVCRPLREVRPRVGAGSVGEPRCDLSSIGPVGIDRRVFSATLLSIEQLHLSVNESLLAASWCLFAAFVVIGPTSVALEARARYVITWRSLQPQDFDAERKLTRLERLQLLGVLLYSVALRPRSLFYARDTDYNATQPTQGMWMNFRMVLALQFVWDIALALEIVLWAVFSAAVIVLIAAFFP